MVGRIGLSLIGTRESLSRKTQTDQRVAGYGVRPVCSKSRLSGGSSMANSDLIPKSLSLSSPSVTTGGSLSVDPCFISSSHLGG